MRIVGTANRSMKALRTTMKRRRFGYVLGLTVLVIVLGAAGMLSFELAREVEGGFTSYGHALWWTAMPCGGPPCPVVDRHARRQHRLRLLAPDERGPRARLLLSIYGVAVFGYITASFASFFVGRDASEAGAPVAGSADIARLAEEIRHLRQQLSQSR